MNRATTRTAKEFLERFEDDPDALRVLAIPEIARVVETGDPLRVHAALRRLGRGALSGSDRAEVDRLVADRRRFLAPADPPTLFTLNGIGTRFYGREDPARDGTHVGSRWLTLLYVPFFPLQSYLVRPDGRGWRFFGLVPRSTSLRVKRRIAGGVLAGLALLVFWAVYSTETYRTVHFLNGLDVAVTTEFDGRTLQLAPGARLAEDFGKGAAHVRTTTADGRVVEEMDIEVPRNRAFSAYNVLGAAPLRIRDVVYTTNGGVLETKEPPDVGYGGQSWVAGPFVDHAFVEPPKTIRMHLSRQVNRAAYLESGGWRTAVSHVEARGPASVAAFTAAIALADPEGSDSLGQAVAAAQAVGGDALRRLAKDFAERTPRSVGAQRAAQACYLVLGEKDRLLAEAKATYEKDKTSAEATYLYARLLSPKEEVEVMKAALERHPEDRWLLRSASWCANKLGRHAEAVDLYDRLARVDPRSAQEALEERTRSLVVARGTAAAQRAAKEAADRGHKKALMLYAKLAGLDGADPSLPPLSSLVRAAWPGHPHPDGVEAQLWGYARNEREFARLESRIESLSDRAACRLCIDSARNLSAAVGAVPRADEKTVALLDDTARLAIACELLRLGDADAAGRVHGGFGLPLDALRDPAAASADEELDAEVRATLLVAAARRTADDAERARLLALARDLDSFHCVVPR